MRSCQLGPALGCLGILVSGSDLVERSLLCWRAKSGINIRSPHRLLSFALHCSHSARGRGECACFVVCKCNVLAIQCVAMDVRQS